MKKDIKHKHLDGVLMPWVWSTLCNEVAKAIEERIDEWSTATVIPGGMRFEADPDAILAIVREVVEAYELK